MYKIYRLTNTTEHKVYIGQTLNIKRRIKEHKSQYKDWDNFTVNILHQNLSKEEADFLEKKEIQQHNSLYPHGYNLQDGGSANRKTHSETCKKISNSCTGLKRSAETCKKMSESQSGENNINFGKFGKDHPRYGTKTPHSAESKKQMSISHFGIQIRRDVWNEAEKIRKLYKKGTSKNKLKTLFKCSWGTIDKIINRR